jgi:hypothetical protein
MFQCRLCSYFADDLGQVTFLGSSSGSDDPITLTASFTALPAFVSRSCFRSLSLFDRSQLAAVHVSIYRQPHVKPPLMSALFFSSSLSLSLSLLSFVCCPVCTLHFTIHRLFRSLLDYYQPAPIIVSIRFGRVPSQYHSLLLQRPTLACSDSFELFNLIRRSPFVRHS